jgi:hypothetical protein
LREANHCVLTFFQVQLFELSYRIVVDVN